MSAGAIHAQTAGSATGEVVGGATDSDELPPDVAAILKGQASWSASTTAQAAFGYDDNILLSHANTERSAFGRANLEAVLMHVTLGPVDYAALFNAEGTRYFSGKSVRHEAQAFAGLEWRYHPGDKFSFTLDGQAYYLDQIFDVSNTDITRVVAELKLSGLKAGPTVRWSPVSWLWLEGKGNADRQKFRDGANDARIREESLRLGWQPVKWLELSAAGFGRRRDYDRRVQYTAGGQPDVGLLVVHEREAEGRAVVTWGASGHWVTTTRAGGLHFIDNGSGYLNFHQRNVAQEVDWSAGRWSVHAEGVARRKEYELQTVGRGVSPPIQVKDEFSAELRVERKVSARWTVYAEYDWERSRSNFLVSSYRVNEGLLGARWSWEK